VELEPPLGVPLCALTALERDYFSRLKGHNIHFGSSVQRLGPKSRRAIERGIEAATQDGQRRAVAYCVM
jgi:hypothetical protein